MKYLIATCACFAGVLAAQSFGGGTAQAGRSIETRLRDHDWRVEFANGVVQTNSFREHELATSDEPLRKAVGDVKYEAGALPSAKATTELSVGHASANDLWSSTGSRRRPCAPSPAARNRRKSQDGLKRPYKDSNAASPAPLIRCSWTRAERFST